MAQIDSQRAMAARLAARSQLRDVRLFGVSSTLEAMPDLGRPLGYELNLEPRAEWDEGDAAFAVKCEYTLTLQQRPDDDGGSDDPSTDLATAIFTLGALFELQMREGDAQPSQEELNAYAVSTGSFALYPFAREYVRDLTSRMGLPPLTLGVLLQPISQNETTAIENKPEQAAIEAPSADG